MKLTSAVASGSTARIWRAAVLWFCAALVMATQAWADEVPVVTLDDTRKGISLVGRMGFLEDPEGRLGIDEIRGADADARFAVPARIVSQPGTELHARWFKIRVRQTDESRPWLIDTSNTALRQFSVYGPYDMNGVPLRPPLLGGIALPSAEPQLDGDRFLYRFRLPKPGDYTLYIRTVSQFPEYYRLTVWDAVEFGQVEQRLSIFHGMCYGLMVSMLVYNLILISVFRQRMYAYNFLGCLFAMVTIAAINGHVGRYLLPYARGWIPIVLAASPPLWMGFAGLFGRSFIELSRHSPRFDKALRLLDPLCALAVGLALSGQIIWSLAVTQAIAVFGPVSLFIAALMVLRRGFRPAAWYIAGLSVVFVTAIGTTLNNFGVLELPFHYEALQLGILIEIAVFMLALGSRIRLIRNLNGELGLRATQLAKAAETDPLTGLLNRAGWTEHGAAALGLGGAAAVLLLDLDHFKAVNDAQGHAAGDEVLVAVSVRLSNEVGSQGLVARLGGDEFAVLLFDVADQEALQLRAQRLIGAISEPVPSRGHRLRVGA
ncbi:MAG: hypothetical protein JWQ88_3879, partial [Rhodoferax sp.]|nr:hypothetical protein [Rhodoferax sp.]